MNKNTSCTDCGSQQVSITKKVIDQVSGWDMPNALKSVGGLLLLGFGQVPVAYALTTGSPLPVLALFVVLDVFMVFFGWQICWLSFWGQPVAQINHQCADCGYAWSTREDGSQRVELPSLPAPVRRSRRMRARA
jgi:hypothetical protein